MTIYFDNHCPKCILFKKYIQKIDWLNVLVFRELRGQSVQNAHGIDILRAHREIASHTQHWAYGFDTLVRICQRVILLLPLLPLFYLLQYTGIGKRLYRNFADNRQLLHCTENTCQKA